MKANIKITLIGVLTLSFFGLVYAFLGSSPEMVANSNHRIEEPPLQSPNSMILHASVVEDSVAPTPITSLSDESQAEELDSVNDANLTQFIEPAQVYSEVEEIEDVKSLPETVVVDSGVEEQIDTIEEEPLESVSTLSSTDVVVIDSSDDFLNLNLVETKPISMVLVEGDELIFDDVNEGLSKFKSIIEKDSVEVATESVVVEISDAVVESSDQKVVPIVIPDADQELMKGTDKISLEYQASMEKLLEVKQQMAEADAENEKLNEKFSSVVNQNRELAILIRDIDMKIKTLTASN